MQQAEVTRSSPKNLKLTLQKLQTCHHVLDAIKRLFCEGARQESRDQFKARDHDVGMLSLRGLLGTLSPKPLNPKPRGVLGFCFSRSLLHLESEGQ